MITQQEVRKQLSYNKKTGTLTWKVNKRGVKKGSLAGNKNSKGYIVICINGKTYKAHRLIWLGMTGMFPKGQINHIDQIKHNNIWENLEDVSQSVNMRNMSNKSDNTSSVKGIWFQNGKWCVRISHLKKKIYLGSFSDFKEAVCHRLAAEQCLNWAINKFNSSAYKYVKEK